MEPFARLVEHSSAPKPRHWICHCLLVELPDRLLLVDSGLGSIDVRNPAKRMGALRGLARPRLDPALPAIAQVKKLGYDPKDVRDIVLTHLDFDHVGGIVDFPSARVHAFGLEFLAAFAPATFWERLRYNKKFWSHHPHWEVHSQEGESWFGFDSVRPIGDLPEEVFFVPLPGHSLGHCGVAIKNGDQWILHAGDSYFFHREIDPVNPKSPLALRTYQRLLQVDEEERLDNLARLRELKKSHADQVRILCAHDPNEFREQRSV